MLGEARGETAARSAERAASAGRVDRAAAAPAGSPELAAPAPASPPLRRNLAFQVRWAGSAASTLGMAVADVAYPLAILTVTGSPADAGLFAAAQMVGTVLAGLPAGYLADRRSPRALLIGAEINRALVTAVVAAALALGALSLPLLLAAALLLGAGQPLVRSVRLLMVRAIVPQAQLATALTQDEVRINGADLAGPPLGGALYGIRALAHAVPFVFTAASFALSLISAVVVRMPVSQASPGSSTADPGSASRRPGMLVGLKAIWSDPALKAATTLLAMLNAVGVGLNLVAVVVLRAQSVPAGLSGVALAGSALGGLAGAPLVRPLHKLPPGVLLIVICAIEAPLVALMAVPCGPWWMAGVLFAGTLGMPAIRVLLDVLILRQAPAEQRGRIIGAVLTLLTIGMPAGVALSGLMLQFLPAQVAMLVMAGLLGAGVLYSATKRQLWRARWPA